jgi:uncharacterized caspase-like protein
MKRVLLAIFSALVGLTVVSPAWADRRVALVVGNAHYSHTATLANPPNDATDIADKLKVLGFDVALRLDLDQANFAAAIDEFARRLEGADVGLLYYAGHALQINDKNFLVSVNAKLENAFLVPGETIELEPIVRLMESKVSTNLIFLDACRNNPLADNLKRTLMATNRSVALGRGLARIEPASRDTLIAFAAAPGQEASDGVGRNSPFTAALLNHISQPGVEISVMLKQVAAEVREKTANGQRPQQLSDMSKTFYFAKAQTEPASTMAAAEPRRPAEPDHSLELAFWSSVSAANDCDSMRAYLRRFPSGSFTDLARLSEKRLCADTAARATATPAGEAARLPPPSIAPASTSTSGPSSLPAAAPASPTAQQSSPTVALLTPATEPSGSDNSDVQAVSNLQRELLRVGCAGDDLRANGVWSPAWRGVAVRFNSSTNSKLDPDRPSADAALQVKAHEQQACTPTCGAGLELREGRCVAKSNAATRSRKHPAAHAPEPSSRDVARRPAATRDKRSATADNPPPLVTPPGNPNRESYTYVGNKRCRTFEPPGAAPRIICP